MRAPHSTVSGPARGRFQVAVHHAPASPPVLQHLVVAHAFLAAGVVIGIERLAVLLRGLQEGLGHRIAFRDFMQAHGAVVAAPRAAFLIAFDLAEQALGLGPVPARRAGRLPAVVVRRLAAHIDHAVDQRGAAHALAARHGDAAAVHVVLGLGGEAPVVVGIDQQLGKSRGNADPGTAGLVAGLQHQHAVLAVGAQAVGQDAAGGAAAGDDEIVIAHRLRPARPSSRPSARSGRPAWARHGGRGSRAPPPLAAAPCRAAA